MIDQVSPTKTKVSLIGLGKLGAPLLVAIASRGFKVIGVDVVPKTVRAINSGSFRLTENKFSTFLKKFKSHISATNNLRQTILESDITFIVVPTPSTTKGSFSNKHVLQVINNIGRALNTKSTFHLVVIISTISPGSTIYQVKPALEKSSGKICGQDFGLIYNPAFVSLGNVVNDFLKPDLVLIGESDYKSGQLLVSFYKNVCLNKPQIKRMNFINAEIAKLALNTYITTKISYANMLAELCEKLPKANIDTITSALGADSRIGAKYFIGATSYGGPCFPRDNKALKATADKIGISMPLAKTTDHINSRQIKRVVALAKSKLPNKSKVAILGLTYQTNTDIVDESAGLKLADSFSRAGFKVKVYDPKGINNARQILGKRVNYSTSAKKCIENSQCIMITTPWKEFKQLKAKDFGMQKPWLIDFWRIIDSPKTQSVVKYYPIGIHSEKVK